MAENAPRCYGTGEQVLPPMTATDNSRGRTHNSISLQLEGDEGDSERDARARRIVEQTNEGGTTTRKDLLKRMELTEGELDELLRVLAAAGYVDRIGEGVRESVLLTCRGERVTGGER